MVIQKSERFEMRLDPESVERVDTWRSAQSDLPSRAEAIRRLIQVGLGNASESRRGPINLSDGEKLILLMLCNLFKEMKLEDAEMDPEFLSAAIHRGHLWSLEWEYSGIFHGHEDDPAKVRETGDILEMWSFIEWGYAACSEEEKERIANEVPYLGKSVRFMGFDGNSESEYMGIAGFLVEKMNRYENFSGRNFNSHVPSLDGYRRMLPVFDGMRSSVSMGGNIGASQIIKLLTAQLHPSRRAK